MNQTKIPKNIVNHNLLILRSENDIFNSQEIDILNLDKEAVKKIIEEALNNGLLLDQIIYNYPHIKLKETNGDYQEYDILTQVYYYDKSRCFQLLKNENNLKTEQIIINNEKFNILNSYDYYITLLIHAFTDKNSINQKYNKKLLSLKATLSKKKLITTLDKYTISHGLFKMIEKSYFNHKNIKITKKIVFLFNIKTQPILYVKCIYKKLQRLFLTLKKRIFRFKVIVFMGADGAGKTTTINTLMESIGNEKCHYIHLGNRSNLLPTTKLINYFKSNKSTTKKIKDTPIPQKMGIKIFLKAFIYNTNYYLEILANICFIYIKNIFFLKKDYIFVDRYIYDRYINKKSLFLFYFFPAPDFIFFIDAETEILLERKQEHSKEIIQSFQKRYFNFIKTQKFSKTMRIDSGNNLILNINIIKKVLQID